MDTFKPPHLDNVEGPLGKAFLLLVHALYANLVLLGHNYEAYPKDHSPILAKEKQPEYDFIIVGASTAGCLLANRLSKKNRFKVLLLEAGGIPSATSEVPNLFYTLRDTEEDWSFKTKPYKHLCQSMMNQECTIHRGKVLGGSSTINNLQYGRGNPKDYDEWEFSEWSSEETTRFFKHLEGYAGTKETGDVGSTGDVHLEHVNANHFMKASLQSMYEEAGYMKLRGNFFIGWLEAFLTIKNKVRHNMAKAFLGPVKDRPNLFVSLLTEATTISFCTEGNETFATGVWVKINGKEAKFIKAKKEIILTASPVNNPKILLNSGIGPADHLRSNKVRVIKDIPGVGKNLHTHLGVPVFISMDKMCVITEGTMTCISDTYHDNAYYNDTLRFILNKDGAYTLCNIKDFILYLSTEGKLSHFPNIKVYHLYFARKDFYIRSMLESYNFHPAIVDSILRYNEHRSVLIFIPTLLKPHTRAEVLINSTNRDGPPTIQWYEFAEEDQNALINAVKMIVNMTQGEAMIKHRPKLMNIDIPHCRNIRFCSDPYFKCLVNSIAFPMSNVAGSTKMGEDGDETAVVNKYLKVFGVGRLRVGDSSIAPEIVSSNTIGADALIGQKVSNFIKHKWVKGYEPSVREIVPPYGLVDNLEKN